jgi:3-phosphoshikimate 1-carboxyvinyltransferase
MTPTDMTPTAVTPTAVTPTAATPTAVTPTAATPTAATLTVQPSLGGLHGRLRVPGDKSISHRAILLAALAPGASHLNGLSGGEDVAHTLGAVRACGATVTGGAPGEVVVSGGTLGEPAAVLDVGNSGTGIRLLAGWAAAHPWLTVLQGDASIAGRPMARVAEPLRAMGATVDGRRDGRFPPLVIRGGRLRGMEFAPPIPSAQVKSAILLAGLGADGPTTVREAIPTRAHTEELMVLAGAEITSVAGEVTLHPSALHPFDLDVPGDPSQAAFWVVAACVVPGSDLLVEHVYVGPGRAGFLAVLARMGAKVTLERHDPDTHTADIRARHSTLRATDVGGREIPDLIDEIPVLAVAAAYAEGVTTFRDAAELKVKETDRIATVTSELGAVGVHVEARDDGLQVTGSPTRLAGGQGSSHGDHRIAMALAVAGLAAAGPVQVGRWDAVATSYPGFEEDLQTCVS